MQAGRQAARLTGPDCPVQVRLGVSCSWSPCLPAPSTLILVPRRAHHAVEFCLRAVTLRSLLCHAGLAGPTCLPGHLALLDIVLDIWCLHPGVSRLSATRQPTKTASHSKGHLGCSSQIHRTSQAHRHPEKGFISDQQLHPLHLEAIGRKIQAHCWPTP